MMDLKEIIRWFIPCFHLTFRRKSKIDIVITFGCLFLFFNLCAGMASDQGDFNSDVSLGENIESRKQTNSSLTVDQFNISSSAMVNYNNTNEEERSWDDTEVGRTFGRPFKKMVGAMIPLIFQVGAASTWAVVAALVGIKTLAVTLFILKLLLVAGAAKAGALFATKGHAQHESHGWAPPHQKEIHLHIHNGHVAAPEHHEEHVSYSPWNREGLSSASAVVPDLNSIIYKGGPQTISTPFGNYVKIEKR